MQIEIGIACLQIAQQILVPIQLERGMVAALQQRLIAAQRDGLLDLGVKLLTRQYIGVLRPALAVEVQKSHTAAHTFV